MTNGSVNGNFRSGHSQHILEGSHQTTRQRRLVEFLPADMGDARDNSVWLIRPPTPPGINGGWIGGDLIGKNRIVGHIRNLWINVVH